MITFQPQLEPSTKISWWDFKPTTVIDWLFTGARDFSSVDQVAPAKGPKSIVQTAIFTIGGNQYDWTVSEW